MFSAGLFISPDAMDGKPRPKSLEIIGEELLAVVWEDGHESLYPGGPLRGQCPCADCRSRRVQDGAAPAPPGGPASAGGLTLVMAPPRLVGMERVGRYAVRLRWSDGHSAGLFDFALLRSVCPCEACGGGER
jgi:DUF971 family protein